MPIKQIFIAAAVVGLAAVPADAGSLGASEVSPSLDWVSDCDEPVRPKLFLDDIRGYNQALADFNAYVAQVEAYIDCVQADGSADIDALAKAVSRSMQEQQNAAIKAAEELRTDLEIQRSLLR